MNSTELLTTLTGGIRSTHFFNGRLLTAEDLRVEQGAHRQQRQQLGQAIGEGVVYGLEVALAASSTAQRPALRVTRGLALNRQGEAVALAADVEVALGRDPQAPATAAGVFAQCMPLAPQTPGIDVGFYLLTARPASGFEGQAPMVGLSQPGVATGCGSRHTVEGVKFCLVPLTLAANEAPSGLRDQVVALAAELEAQLGQLPFLNDLSATQLRRTIAVNVSKLRNGAAHLCFGTETLAEFPSDPLERMQDGTSPYTAYGALEALRQQGSLTGSDVPLALLYWTTHGVQFVDMWSVRRRLIQPLADVLWPLHVGQRRVAEAEAMFAQFQQQLLDIVPAKTNSSFITAKSHFLYLPPAGYLPLGPLSFARDLFFQDLTVDPLEVDVAFLRLLVQQSWFLEPMNLTAPPPIRLYTVPGNPNYVLFIRQERQLQSGQSQPAPTPPSGPSTGRINIDVDVSEASATSRTTGLSFGSGMRLQVGQDIKVWAEDALGNEYIAQFISTRSGVTVRGDKDFEFDKGIARFTIKALPPGPYTVRARMKGFKEVSQHRQLQAGQTLHLVFKLVAATTKPGGKVDPPPKTGQGTWIHPDWYDKVAPIDKHIKWPWPPEEIVDFDLVTDPPPEEVGEWMQAWGDWVRQQYPDAPVNPGDISLYIAQSHTPDVTAQEPYAYLVFGAGGAYMPVVLTPVDRTLDHVVSVTKGGLAGIDNDVANQLKDVGLSDLDVLGASWQRLVSEALGVGAEAAGSVIGEARTRVDTLQGSLQIFSGVDSTLENGLRNAGINNTVALANTDAQTLVDQLSEQGVTLGFARRLVDEARQTVPASAWSLGAEQLGLKDQEIAALQALGVNTQGVLQNRAAEPAGQAQLSGALGISTEALNVLVGGIDLSHAAAEVGGARVAGAPVTSLVGVNSASARALTRLSLGTVGAVARADVDVVARAFGGDVARATEVVNAARGRTNIPQ